MLIGKDVSTGITIFYHSRCRLRCGCGLLKNNNNEQIPGLTESYNHEEICARDDGSSVEFIGDCRSICGVCKGKDLPMLSAAAAAPQSLSRIVRNVQLEFDLWNDVDHHDALYFSVSFPHVASPSD